MIDIVIPTINLKYTDICLKSLRKRTKREDYRLILIADQAKPEDHAYLDNVDADVKIFNDGVQKGVSGVWNQGLEHVKSDYVLIANNDILFFDNWLPRLEAYARAHPEYGCVSAWSHWLGEMPLTDAGEESTNHQLKEYSLKNEDNIMPGMQGCFFMLKKETVEKVGKFDEVTFPRFNFEDCDYLVRMRRAGIKEIIWHGSSLYHWGGRTVGDPLFNKSPNGVGHLTYLQSKVNYFRKWKIEHLLNNQFSCHNSIIYIDGKEFNEYPV